MRITEFALLLVIIGGLVGLVSVMASPDRGGAPQEAVPEAPDPLDALEREFAEVCFGEGFRPGYAAEGDTLVRSMDIMSSVPLQVANLHISRALIRHGFTHEVTLLIPGQGLSFIGATPDGRPARFDLMNALR
jgi:hypothetical protein